MTRDRTDMNAMRMKKGRKGERYAAVGRVMIEIPTIFKRRNSGISVRVGVSVWVDVNLISFSVGVRVNVNLDVSSVLNVIAGFKGIFVNASFYR